MKNYKVEIVRLSSIEIDCRDSIDDEINSPVEDYNIEVENKDLLYNGIIPIDKAKTLAGEIIANNSEATHIHIDTCDGDYIVDFIIMNVRDVDHEPPTESDLIQMEIDQHYAMIDYLKRQKEKLLGIDTSEDDDLPF